MSPLRLVAAMSAAGVLAAGSAVAVAAATGGKSHRSQHANVASMTAYAAAKKSSQGGNCPNMGSGTGSTSAPGV
jgi:hypothetical protein